MARKDWRKQLFRVKQMADQNLGRVEKTEALTAELQALEKKVEQYGKIFGTTGKKLLQCFQGQPGQDIEKRQKKLPEYALATNLLEGSQTLGLDTLLGQVFQICGDAESQVSSRTLQNELNIENRVLEPIQNLIEVDIPAMQKHKRNLQRLVLDMDSAKTRYLSAQKEQSKGNNNPGSTKVESLRDEYEEACYKVDQCRDQLATELFTLASREAELSTVILELIKCQANHHKQCLEILERRIPQVEEQIDFHQHMPVYGKSLEDHLRRTERTIALVIEECIRNLILLGGMEEEGLFRIAGAANKVKKLKAALDSEQCADIAEEYDVHVIAGALKLYLRELPDPLMTSDLYPDWMQAAHLPADQRLKALADVVAKLPKVNFENLRFLIKFLCKLADYQEVNKMSSSNIAIVIGPNLIWPKGESGPSVLTTSTQSAIVEALIMHSDYFFPGDIDFQEYSNLQDSPTASLRRDKNDKSEKSPTAYDTDNKRHGVNAGLGITQNTFLLPISTPNPAKFTQNETSPNSTSNKVTHKLGGDQSPEETITSGYTSVAYRERPTFNPVCKSASSTDNESNGRYKKSSSVSDGDGFGVANSDSQTRRATRSLIALDESSNTAITPPPKGAPPRGMHSDVYNTVFALQSLGNGWPDYLTRVRTLWDGHMDQRTSFSSNGVGNSSSVNVTSPISPPGNYGGAVIGAKSDEDFLEKFVDNNNLHHQSATQPDLLESVPQTIGSLHSLPLPSAKSEVFQSQGHHLPVQSLIGSIHINPNNVNTSDEMSTSTGSLDMPETTPGTRSVGASPKPPKRFGKKPAPMPPLERPQGPAPPPPPSPLQPSEKSTHSPSVAEKPATPAQVLPYPLKPPLPGRPLAPSLEQHTAAQRPDRPPSPTRRPSFPPPDRPQPTEKPSKPEKPPISVGEKPALPATMPGHKKSQSLSERSPPLTAKFNLNVDNPEKPLVPPQPLVISTAACQEESSQCQGHKRSESVGGRPPRPQPPLPPNKSISVSDDRQDVKIDPSDVPPSPGPENTYL